MTRKTRMLLLFVPLALLLLSRPAVVLADAKEDVNRLGQQCWAQMNAGNYREAERLALRLKRMAEGPLADEPLHLAAASSTLGSVYWNQGRYAEAEPLLKRALAIKEESLGVEHSGTAESVSNLANLYNVQGRCAEAEPLYKRAFAIFEKTLGAEHLGSARNLNNLAVLYRKQAAYTEAEPLLKRALAIREKARGPQHPETAESLNNLALLYDDQGRYDEAEPLYKRALAIKEETLGPGHPTTASSLSNLANLYSGQGRYSEAEPLCKRALAIYEKALGPEHPSTAKSLNNLALLYQRQGRYDEAEPLYKRALAIKEETLGPGHPTTASSLNNLAILYYNQGRCDEAEPLCSRAAAIMDRTGADPDLQCKAYWVRSKIAWKTDRREQAVADLERAMDLAERIRAQSSGGEIQRAQNFAQYGWIYEAMVGWQTELGNPAAGLAAIERSRARGLVDQMATAGMDLLVGVEEELAARLRRSEQETQGRAASFNKQLEVLAERNDLSANERRVEREELQTQLRQAQQDYAAAYAEIRNASPAYRLAVGEDRKPVPLAKLKLRVTDQDALLLEYLLGQKEGFVLIVPADGEPRLEKLAVTEEQAESLGIDAGPLTAKRLAAVLRNDEGTGLLQRLARPNEPKGAKHLSARLAVLWQVLIPEAQRNAIRAEEYKRLIVVPDGSLANLPFESLVVAPGEDPEYLLDVGPPIEYSPSATILINLARRKTEGVSKADAPVLTVGDCQYERPSEEPSETLLAELRPKRRYGAAGGHLSNLPHTAWEVAWVSEVFEEYGIGATRLEDTMADEQNVRANLAGRRVLHFACHGLVDQSYGNLFGALAFTPGPNSDDPVDDGFLTLAEVYEQNLTGCELAILSACDTNTGPEQRGEGVWALSRGFLVAGSRRVVASNWLVDDEAAASLVSYYCSILAKAEQEGRTPDYAEALHEAKRWCRSQEKWESPYYWSTFVLVGPN